MPKYMVAAHQTRLFKVEAPNEWSAGNAVKNVMHGLTPENCRVERDKDGDDAPVIESIDTFEQYFGDEKPDW